MAYRVMACIVMVRSKLCRECATRGCPCTQTDKCVLHACECTHAHMSMNDEGRRRVCAQGHRRTCRHVCSDIQTRAHLEQVADLELLVQLADEKGHFRPPTEDANEALHHEMLLQEASLPCTSLRTASQHTFNHAHMTTCRGHRQRGSMSGFIPSRCRCSQRMILMRTRRRRSGGSACCLAEDC